MEIQEGNKLIAEFMGCYGATHYVGGETVFYWGFKDTHITERWDERDFEHTTPYHSSWDWLMPVVEKINKSGNYRVRIFFDANGTNGIYSCYIDRIWWENSYLYDERICGRSGIENPIQIVWLAVIQFIQWYNTRNE